MSVGIERRAWYLILHSRYQRSQRVRGPNKRVIMLQVYYYTTNVLLNYKRVIMLQVYYYTKNVIIHYNRIITL